MRNIQYTLLRCFMAVCLATVLYSCDDFLNTESRNTLTEPTQWGSEVNADVYLNGIYSTMNKPNTPDPLDSFTDDNDGGPYWASWQWKQGIASPEIRNGYPMTNNTTANDFMNWSAVYERVRKCNEFLEQVEAHKENFSAEWLNKRKDEVRYLRAFFYAGLWQHVGGVILLTETLDRNTMTEDELYRKRNTFEETYNFISTELGEIAANGYLDIKYSNGDANAGRATLGAALALKGWVDLYAASPGFNAETPVAADGTGATPEQVKLVGFGNYDKARWEKAAATNKEFLTKYKSRYQLFTDMSKFWSESTEYNSEVIWDRPLERGISGLTSDFAQKGGPTYINGKYYTWGNYCPTQELVDEFCMSNGLPISDPNSGYDPENPYANREQRFHDFIVFDGAAYKMNWMEKEDIIYTRIDKVNPSKNEIELAQSDVTRTGYYFKKRMDPDWEPSGIYGINYVYFRYAEVLLNYAEAQNEAYGPAEVYAVIDELRVARELPTLQESYGRALSQDEMRDVIHRERRVELCFENKRYYDLIRWREAYDIMNKELHGMKIYNTNASDNSGKWVHERLPLSSHPHVFHKKMYMCPIPYSVITANSKIVQNPGY